MRQFVVVAINNLVNQGIIMDESMSQKIPVEIGYTVNLISQLPIDVTITTAGGTEVKFMVLANVPGSVLVGKDIKSIDIHQREGTDEIFVI